MGLSVSFDQPKKGWFTTYAVLLLIKVIFAKASRSARAPALKRSEKWSSAADMILDIVRYQGETETLGTTHHSPPSHLLTELDHPGGKAMTRLGQSLDSTSRHVVLSGHHVNGHLVAQVPQLKR